MTLRPKDLAGKTAAEIDQAVEDHGPLDHASLMSVLKAKANAALSGKTNMQGIGEFEPGYSSSPQRDAIREDQA